MIWGDQMIRKGFLRPLERLLLHSPLMVWAPFASNVYHDLMWYPTIGQSRIREFMRTEWGTAVQKVLRRWRSESTARPRGSTSIAAGAVRTGAATSAAAPAPAQPPEQGGREHATTSTSSRSCATSARASRSGTASS